MKLDVLESSLRTKDTPVVFSDTCSLLDILRLPSRTGINISHLNGLCSLIDSIDRGLISSVLIYKVREEFFSNESSVATELERTINKMIQNVEKFVTTLQVLDAGYSFQLSGIDQTNLSYLLKTKLHDFLGKSLLLDKDDIVAHKGLARAEKPEPPASHAKNEFKDCLIIEHVFETAEKLRNAGFDKKIFFVSSNSTDYGKIANLKPPLDQEFSRLNILYINNYNWVISELKNGILI